MSEELTKDAWKPKIDAELWKVMEGKSDDDLITVWLWLNSVDQEIIKKALIGEKGMDPAVYESRKRFEEEIASEITKRLEEELGYEEAHLKGEDGMSPVERAVSAKSNEYVWARREITIREYSEVNDKLVADNIGEKPRKILYNSRITATLVVEATKAEIEIYAKNKLVHDISLYVRVIPTPNLNITLGQTEASTIKDSPYSYKGNGMKIGVVEALETGTTNGRFDPFATQLVGANISFENIAGQNVYGQSNGSAITNGGSPITITNSNHATFVSTIVVGQPIYSGGVKYEGVVPLARVYQTPVFTSLDVECAIYQLSLLDCTVINLSLGVDYGVGYYNFDREVDRLIVSTGVTVVVAAGNNAGGFGTGTNNITSPAKALNAITVGSVATKSGPTTALMPLFSRSVFSSTGIASYLPLKPDIYAPGSNISCFLSAGTVTTDNGTSFATSHVTGIVAQVMNIFGSYLIWRLDPTYYKAALMFGAYNTQCVNARWANWASSRGQSGSITSTSVTYPIGYYYWGQVARCMIVFEKGHDGNITGYSSINDLNIRLIDSNGNIVATTTSTRDNVKVLEHYITEDDDYSIEVYPTQRVSPVTSLKFYLMW